VAPKSIIGNAGAAGRLTASDAPIRWFTTVWHSDMVQERAR
jgi:hypothetical protein